MSDNRNIVPFAPPAPPAVPFGDMARLAEAVAKSGLFGIKTPDQALALMALAQAEGRHPATVARDYHIINGSPSKKAEAMQRDFLMAGGKIDWHELTDEAVDATFSHPLGGTARIRWDAARCKQAGLTGGNHAKFPRQMKRSRVVSEGVRTVWPLATSGMYVPEEVVEFAAPPHPKDARAELDAFAAAKPGEVIDGEAGESASVEFGARTVAAQGWAALQSHLRSLPDAALDRLRDLLGTRDAPGELRRIAREADERRRFEDDFGPPGGEPPPSPAGPIVNPEGPRGAASRPAGDDGNNSPGAGAEPGHVATREKQPLRAREMAAGNGSLRGDGRTAGSIPATGATHSPAGGQPASGVRTEPMEGHAVAADKPHPAPAGEIPDMFDGKPRKPVGHYHVTLPDSPNSDDWDNWYGAITAMIGNDPHDAILRDNRTNIEIFGQFDKRHNALMRKLEAR